MFHKVLLVVFAAFTLASAIPLGKFFFILWRPDTKIDVRDNELDAAALYKEAKADVVINSRGLSGCTVYKYLSFLKIISKLLFSPALAEILAEAKTNVVQDRGLSKCPDSPISHGMADLTDCGKAEVELFSEANTDVLQNGK